MNTKDNKLTADNGHKQAELVMQAGLQLLPLIMNNIPQAVFWKDRDLVYLGCNKAFADDAGFSSPEEIVGKTDFDMPWTDQAELYRADDRLVMESGEPKLNYEEPQTTPNGSTIWLSTSKIPVYENGQVIAVLAMYEDITARKQAEADLLLRDRALASSLNAVIIVNISDNKPIYVNDALLKMTGYTREEVMQIGLTDITGSAEELKKIRAAIQAQGFFVGDELLKRKDGSVFPANFFSSLIIGAEGRPVAVQTSFFDITERKQAEKALQESEQQFHTLYDNATIGLYRTTPDGRILMINPAGLQMLGFDSFEEFSKRNLEEAGFEEKDARNKFREKIEREGVIDQESKWIRKDGSTVFVREGATVLHDEHGKVMYYDGSFEDITERKQAEEALRESEERFRRFAEATVEGLVFHEQGRIVDVNPSAATMFGLSDTKELIGRNLLEFIVPEFHQMVMKQMQLESVLPYEIQGIRKDGTTFPVETSTRAYKDGERIIRASSIRDITERKQLETQVQEAFERRGYQVQVSTEISQEVAAASELSDLFDRVVTLTKERLGYYHTQLLRYDAARDAVVLINGYGETGKKMLAGGHQMPMGSGLIGTAAASGETVLRPVLSDDPDWHPNPLLPNTQGEIAVPIKWKDTVLGVLDVQSDRANALSDEDRLLLEGLCGQIAIAMQSAELVKTIRENEARLAEALRAARLANWEYDVEKDIFTFNDQFYSIFHTTAEKAGGYQLSSARYAELFVHPDDMEVVGAEIGKALSSTERVYNTTIDHRIRYEDGGIGYITVQLTVERDENGKITRYYGANQDITERKQAELALAEALRAARLANWEYDVEKDIFTFNDQFYSIFHTTAEKAGGYQLSSARYAELFVHPDDMEVVGAEIGKALSSTERVYNTTIDHRIRYEDGGIGYITVQLTVERDENGKITRYYGANQDITERKQAEEALRRSEQEMADRLEEINRLYQNLSHEGWQAYRATEDLPEGFVFDQTGTKPVGDETVLVDGQFASVPMRVLGGEAIGTLEVADDPQHPRSPEDYVFLQQVSEQIALALEGARLAAQTQSALAQSEKLFEASRTLTQATDLQELTSSTVTMLGVQEINRAIMSTFNYDPEGNIESLDIIANWSNGTGHEVTAIGTHYPLSVIRAMSFFVSPTPVFFNDTHTDERVDATTMKLVQNLNLRSVAVLPLHTGTRQIGALILEGEEPHTFTDDETRLFSALAPQISTVLENRRQFERAQQQAERESTLNIISQKIQSATTVEAVLQIAARELGHALGAPMTIAQLSMKDKK